MQSSLDHNQKERQWHCLLSALFITPTSGSWLGCLASYLVRQISKQKQGNSHACECEQEESWKLQTVLISITFNQFNRFTLFYIVSFSVTVISWPGLAWDRSQSNKLARLTVIWIYNLIWIEPMTSLSSLNFVYLGNYLASHLISKTKGSVGKDVGDRDIKIVTKPIVLISNYIFVYFWIISYPNPTLM